MTNPHAYSPDLDRAVAAGELGILGELLPMIAPDALPELRRLLRSARWQDCGPALAVVRAMHLDTVARRLVDEVGGPWTVYLAGTGDLLPDAPDDLAQLE